MSLLRAVTVGDFHNAGVFPPHGRFLLPFIVKHTDLVIVSNPALETEISKLGGNVTSSPDPIPHIEPNGHARGNDAFDVFFICSWAPDEPISNVLGAAEILTVENPSVRILITGRPRLAAAGWTRNLPPNIVLTGYLSDKEFEHALCSSSLVIDLTTRPDCMVCGAYEAVAAGVPMILSDNAASTTYFTRGTLFTDNTARNIADQILRAVSGYSVLKPEIKKLKQELLDRERITFERIHANVRELAVAKKLMP